MPAGLLERPTGRMSIVSNTMIMMYYPTIIM